MAEVLPSFVPSFDTFGGSDADVCFLLWSRLLDRLEVAVIREEFPRVKNDFFVLIGEGLIR